MVSPPWRMFSDVAPTDKCLTTYREWRKSCSMI